MRVFIVAVLLLAVFAFPAWGDVGGIPHNPHDAEHTTVVGLTTEDGYSGAFDTSTNGTWEEVTGEDGQLHWMYDFYDPDGYDIVANDGSGTVIGEIISLNYDGKPDPQVQLGFSCRARASNTTFSFKSSIGVVPQITNAIARATASVTLTDSSENGAFITGLFGGKAYQARYNTSSVFTSLVSSFTVTGGGTTMSENDPVDGVSYRPVAGTITQMEAEYNFILKAWDSASGTSNFIMLGEPVPEPSSMLALASGMIGLIGFGVRKRR